MKCDTRKHIIESEYDCIAYDSGFAVEPGDTLLPIEAVKGDGTVPLLRADPNTSLIHPKTDIPTVRYVIKKEETRWNRNFVIKWKRRYRL